MKELRNSVGIVGVAYKLDTDVVEDDGPLLLVAVSGLRRRDRHQCMPKTESSRRVYTRFTTSMTTEAATTAWVVARPTP